MFGEGAGSDGSAQVGGEAWLARSRPAPGTRSAAMLVADGIVFSEWRVSGLAEHTLFIVLTAGVLLIILYAYFSQAARVRRPTASMSRRISASTSPWCAAAAACGTGTWRAASMYWSRSMYEMLGYGREAMLSFGDVDDIIHPDDGICSSWPTASWRAKPTRSTRSSACATPTANGFGCAPAPRWSIPTRRNCT
jgi:two-component system cell cycle sensor histidine kinase PleC